MKEYVPPCMDKNQKTIFPECKFICSGIVSAGCHGFYLSSDAKKALTTKRPLRHDVHNS